MQQVICVEDGMQAGVFTVYPAGKGTGVDGITDAKANKLAMGLTMLMATSCACQDHTSIQPLIDAAKDEIVRILDEQGATNYTAPLFPF